MNSLLLPKWLTFTPQTRAGELLAELASFMARAASLEEAVRFACRRLAQSLEAEVVVLFALDASDQHLEPVAASVPELELLGHLGLEAVAEWQQAFDDGQPLWSERVPPILLPGLEFPSALVLPVTEYGCTYGCFVVAFDRAAPSPDKEDTQVGQAVAQLFAPQLEARRLCRQLQALDRRRETWHQLEQDLAQSDFSPAALQHLLSAVATALPVEALSLFARDTDHWRRIAHAGATDSLPEHLSLETSRPGTLPLSAAKGPATIIPLGSRKDPVGLLLLRGIGGKGVKGDGTNVTRLALMATVVLLEQQSHRRNQSAEGLFLALFESLPESAFLLDSTGRLQEVNSALCITMGLSATELRNRPLAAFCRSADAGALDAHLQDQLPQPFRLEVEVRARSTAGRAYELHMQPLARVEAGQPLWLGFLRATRTEAQAEDRARLAEARLEGVIDAVQDGVWLLDADGTVEKANQRLAQLFGVGPHDLGVGLPQTEILQGLKVNFANAEEASAGWQRLHNQPDQVAWDEVELLRPHRLLERFARPLLDSRQRLVGRLEVYRDGTGQRFPEDKLVQQERLATLGHLLSGIAHELNNPLTAVTGYAELLRGLRLSGPVRDKVTRLAEEAERASRILKGVLRFARGHQDHKQSVDITELLEKTLSLRTYELKVANIRVVRDYQPDLPPVAANPTHLQQVFLNILLNAEQAIRSQRRHGCITLRACRGKEDGPLQVEIADDGPGIAPAVLPHIFEPFFTIKAPMMGTGLGLSISQAIIRQHGGEISVESRPGQGAVFRIELPPQAVALQPTASTRPTRRQASPRPGRRVLVVDDEPVVAHLIADTLRQQRLTVRVHTDSRRALVEASEKDFDLVICDLRMPELDGPAFYRLLQERKPGLSRRLLFTTGDTLARDTARFLEQVGLPNLAKPFHVDELRAAVSNALNALETAASAASKRQES